MDLMSLPIVMIENILSYLSFDEIARSRLVSRSFNLICSQMLNRGFCMIERRHSTALKNVKAQLPRRESERRYHQLSRHCDILTSIETRISMLNMTYSKFIDHKMCCFIPGKVIDEIKRVLALVETASSPPRAHEVLQELRDISSMAIEHFDDKISPAFRRKLQQGAAQPARPTHSGLLAPIAMRQEMVNFHRRSLLNAKMSLCIASQYKKMYKTLVEHRNLLLRQQRVITKMALKQKDQEATIADLKKRIDECDIKYSEITHTNVGGKARAGTSRSHDVSTPSPPLRHFSSQIKLDLSVLPIGSSSRTTPILQNMKPRKPVIRLPSLSEMAGEDPRMVIKVEPKVRPRTSLQHIKDIANEIRHLNNMEKDSKRAASDSTRPTSDLTGPASDLMRPASDLTRSAIDLMSPASDSKRPANDLMRPASDLIRSASDLMSPASDSKRPANDLMRPASDLTRSASDSKRSASDGSNCAASHCKKVKLE